MDSSSFTIILMLLSSEHTSYIYPTDEHADYHSIVLIHGLHGDRMTTWTSGSGHGAVFWPKDLLPADVGKARYLSFGYDANIAHFWARPSENRMDTFSNDLLQQLENDRYRNDVVSLQASGSCCDTH